MVSWLGVVLPEKRLIADSILALALKAMGKIRHLHKDKGRKEHDVV
jgi:hypothetical protein